MGIAQLDEVGPRPVTGEVAGTEGSAHPGPVPYPGEETAEEAIGKLYVRMLGILEVLHDGAVVPLPPGRLRAALGLLVIRAGEVVPAERMIDELWHGNPPPSAAHALQVYISTLRKLLEPDRPRGAGWQVIMTRPPGYSLVLAPEQCDASRFELLFDEGRRALDHGQPEAARLLRAGLDLWRGPVLADLGDEPFVAAEATRLDELRLAATERWAEAELVLGHHRERVADLEALVHRHPFRERLWGHLIVALYRSGRASDALNAYQRIRTQLAEDLGLEPSPELRALEMAVLRHDPVLALDPTPTVALAPAPDPVGAAPALPARLSEDDGFPFVGRMEERALVERCWKRAERGATQVVFVSGEPGIGKTRLATEVAVEAHRQGALVLFGSCDEDLAVPYQPFVEALRQLLVVCSDEELAGTVGERGGELTRLLPEFSARVPDLPAPRQADPATERYLMFSAVADLFGNVCRRRPAVLLLDDLHWATKPTLLLLRHLVRSADPMALLIIGTYRHSDISRGHPLSALLADLRWKSAVERIALEGLSADESLMLMGHLAGHDLEGPERAMARAVHAEADGSPFFMRELVRHFVDTGLISRAGDRWAFQGAGRVVGVPESVREVIDGRLVRLSDAANRLLTLAAVVGQSFDLAVLATAAGLERAGTIEAMDEACVAALLREVQASPGRYVFAHALIRHAIYDSLGPARRMELHRVVAQTLESLTPAEPFLSELAHHWVEAIPATGASREDLTTAAGYAEQAGQQAMASLAYEEAVTYFAGAVGAARQLTDRSILCGLLIQLGEAQRCAGDAGHRETLLEAGRLAHDLGDSARAAKAALANQRGAYARTGAYSQRVAALESALAAVGPTASPVRAQLLAALATETHFEGQRRLDLAREAVVIGRRCGDGETLGKALAALWFAAWGSDSGLERGSIARELWAVTSTSADGRLRFQAGMCLFLSACAEGDMTTADEALSACRCLADDLAQPLFRWRASSLEALRAMAAGRLDDAEGLARESLRLGEAARQPDRLAFVTTPLVTLRLLQARPHEVEELVAPVLQQFPEIVGYQALLAWALAEEGRAGEAETILARLRPDGFSGVARDYVWLFSMCCLSRAVSRTGCISDAAELYDLLLPYRQVMTTTQSSWIGPVAHDLGLLAAVLGRYELAAEHFSEAVEAQDRIGSAATVVHTRLEWGHMLLTRGRPRDTRQGKALVEEALAGARSVALPAVAAKTRALLAGDVG